MSERRPNRLEGAINVRRLGSWQTCLGLAVLLMAAARPAAAQVTPAAGYTPPDDTPSIRVGLTLFRNYTYQTSRRSRTPTATASTGARSTSRAPTSTSPAKSRTSSPSGSRPTSRARAAVTLGAAARLEDSLVFRIKYAYAPVQLRRLDDARLVGPLRHPADAVGRLRRRHLPLSFPGHGVRGARPLPATMSSSDAGVSFHYNFPSNYGDVHVGVYNGENYQRVEVNDQKAFKFRGTVRPFARSKPVLRGLRATSSTSATTMSGRRRPRTRVMGNVTYEHPYVERRVRLPQRERSALGDCRHVSRQRLLDLGDAADPLAKGW